MKKFIVGQFYLAFNSERNEEVTSPNYDDYPRILEINGDSVEVETRAWGIVTRKIELENGIEIVRNIDNIYGEKFYMRADKPLRSLQIEYFMGIFPRRKVRKRYSALRFS